MELKNIQHEMATKVIINKVYCLILRVLDRIK